MMLPSIPDKAWRRGYEFIADLFYDNERNGTPLDEEALFNKSVREALAIFNK